MTSRPDQQRTRDQVVVTGSLAFDHIMDFPGYFKDHILPEKLHIINISFLVEKLTKQRGGCAGNIAYTLARLGQRPRVVAAAGPDFDGYRALLAETGVDVSAIRIFDQEVTAAAFITTDRADCQIQGFHVGAMARAGELSLAELAGERAALCIVAPDDPGAMLRHCREAATLGLPVFFDPSFQVTAMDGESLARAARGAKALLLNDYELAVFQEKTGHHDRGLFELVEMVVTTLGERGSRIETRDGESIDVPPAPVDQIVDPTGAGDAYRGGFLTGWMRGYELGDCGRMGSVAAAYAVESYGPQGHRYSLEEFQRRYVEAFGRLPA